MKILREYQRRVLKWLNARRCAGIFLEMRLGKTLLMIRHICRLPVHTVLVVAPYSALNSWERELEAEKSAYKYFTVNNRKMRFIYNNKNPVFVLTNKESHLALGKKLLEMTWDCIVLDESTFIKSPTTQVSEFYNQNFKNVPYKYILTGTPAPESRMDYFQQLRFLGIEKRDYWKLRHQYCLQAFEHGWELSVKGELYLNKILSENCYFLSRKDVKIGGEKTYIRRLIQLPKEIKKLYRRVEREFSLADNVKTIYATQQFIWFRRLCSGFSDKKFIDDFKIQELLELLSGELAGKQVIIWCAFLDEIKEISKAFKKPFISHDFICGEITPAVRNDLIKKFQQNKIRVLIIQPETVKYGNDLSCADAAIYFSSPLGLETRQQSEDRIALNDSPLIIDLISEDSVEEDILESLLKKEDKSELQKRIVKRLQKHLLEEHT
jgi:SNF2 family DNA or RNA helicase